MRARLLALYEASGRSPFRRNFRNVAGANLLSQALLVGSTPILSRLYAPDDFGHLALFTSALGVLAAVVTWRFEWLMPNRRTRRAAAALSLAGIAAIVLVTTAVLALVASGRAISLLWPAWSELGDWRLLLPLALAGTGAYQLMQGWCMREGDLAPVGRARLLQSVVYVAVALVGAVIGGAGGLLVASAIAPWAAFGAMHRRVKALRADLGALNRRRAAVVVRAVVPKASIATLVSLVGTTSLSASIIFLSLVRDVADVGVLALVSRVLLTPIGIVTTALSQSFWSRVAELSRERRVDAQRSLYLRVTRLLAVAAVGVALACAAGSLLIVPILGPDWSNAGAVMLALLPQIVGTTIFSPTNHLIVLERQAWQLAPDLTRIVLVGIAVFLGDRLGWSFAGTVLAVSLGSLVAHLLLFATHLMIYRSRGVG